MHATICDMITDLVQNAIEADATEITLKVEETADQLKVEIEDNGKGMSAAVLEKAKDPFYSEDQKHAHRKVGLGLPFLFQTSEVTSGKANIKSKEGIGTTVDFKLNPKHLDLPMFGNFASTATALMAYGFEGNLTIKRNINGRSYEVDKKGLTEALGNLDDAEGLMLLREFFEANEKEISETTNEHSNPFLKER